MIDLKELIKKGVHFGHGTQYWSPDMRPYIWGDRNGIHLINVLKTARLLDAAADFLEDVAAQGKTILLVGTKKAAQPVINQLAKELNVPFVTNRWIGGTFTNHAQVNKAVRNLLNYEDILAKAGEYQYTKKELNEFQKRVERLDKNIGGIRKLGWPIGAVVVVDVKREYVCVKEATAMGIPVVGIVDTNSTPENVNYVIPGNDDSNRSIKILLDYLVESIKRGKLVAEERAKEERAKQAEEAAEKKRKKTAEKVEPRKDNTKSAAAKSATVSTSGDEPKSTKASSTTESAIKKSSAQSTVEVVKAEKPSSSDDKSTDKKNTAEKSESATSEA